MHCHHQASLIVLPHRSPLLPLPVFHCRYALTASLLLALILLSAWLVPAYLRDDFTDEIRGRGRRRGEAASAAALSTANTVLV